MNARGLVITFTVALAAPAVHAADPIMCSAQGGTSCAAPIPDPGTLTSTMTVPADVCEPGDTIACLALIVSFGHSLAGDLTTTLSGGGVTATMSEPTCCEGNGVVRITDGGGPAVGLCTVGGQGGTGGVNRPVTPLAAFSGKAPGGTWTLTLNDGELGGYGALSDWGLLVGCGAHASDLGAACTSDVECKSCSCVDGVCCDTACGGGQPDDCMGCSIAAGAEQDGHCRDGIAESPFHGLPPGAQCDGDDSDRCPTGKLVCVGGATVSCPEVGPGQTERCNGADDDCDGVADEGFELNQPCDGDDADLCATGIWVCSDAGDRTCDEPGPAKVEAENGLDDDCDGLTDEDFPVEPNVIVGTTHGGGGCASGGPASALWLAIAALALAAFARRRRSAIVLAATTIAFVASPRADAYDGRFDARFHQPVPGGATNGVSVDGPLVLQHLQISAGLIADIAANPLVFTLERGGQPDQDVDLLGGELRLDAHVAIGLLDRFQIGLALPLMLARSASDGAEQIAGDLAPAALGDLRIVPKVAITTAERGFGLALAVPVSLPTSGGEYLAGSDGPTLEPRVIVGWSDVSWRVRANLGFILRSQDGVRDLGVGDELRIGLNGEVDVVAERLSVFVEGLAKLAADGDTPDGATTPLELGLGGRLTLGRVHGILLGGGFGLSDGYGTPTAHLYVGYVYTPVRIGDIDGDGLLDDRDQCPTVPEDDDDYQDDDGCPDPDDDADGILDVSDKCRLAPEDKDGHDDDDGCPDPDNDSDGILDLADKCPDKPETKNNYQDDDGCPDEKKKAEVKEKTIDLEETVHFDPGKAEILAESFAMLDDVATLLIAHPELLKIEIAGHTDEIASADYNQKLSEQRAAAVADYLVKKGVARERLAPIGYGETKPLDPGHDEASRQKNRRVELTILERKTGGTP